MNPRQLAIYEGFPTTNLKEKKKQNGNLMKKNQKKKEKRKLNGRGYVAFVPTGKHFDRSSSRTQKLMLDHGSVFFLRVTFIGKPCLGTGKGPYCIPSSPPTACHLNPTLKRTKLITMILFLFLFHSLKNEVYVNILDVDKWRNEV